MEATKASSIVSTKIAVALPISGKKEEKAKLKQKMEKIDCRIIGAKFTKCKMKSYILIWNAENSAI